MNQSYELIIFDLDGTVLDTLGDLRNSLNFALSAKGFPVQSLEDVRAHVGHGIRQLIADSIPAGTPEAVLEELRVAFMGHYEAHCMDETRPYDGICQLLTALRQRGLRLGLLSNKADNAVQALCGHFFPGVFQVVYGERHGVPKKPAPDSVLAVMKELGATAEETLYVGDSEIDAATARNAGIPVALVTWGFRTREALQALAPKYLIDTPEELLSIRNSEFGMRNLL